MTVAWGQNAANGELGLGPEEPKSATKPTRNQPLVGIDVFESVSFPFFLRGTTTLTLRMCVAVSRRAKIRRSSSPPRTRSTRTCNDTPPSSTRQKSA